MSGSVIPAGYYQGNGGWIFCIADNSGPYGVDAAGNLWSPYSAANGGDAWLSPNVFKPFNGLTLLTPQTLWTPAAGKRFQLMGYSITSTIVGGNVSLKDGAGSTIIVLGFGLLGQNITDSGGLGNGITSAGVNNSLIASGAITQVISGYVYGREV